MNNNGTEPALSWEEISRMSKDEYAARREELQSWIEKYQVGRYISPETEKTPEEQANLTWENIGSMTKAEYLARRDEVRDWMSKHTTQAGHRI